MNVSSEKSVYLLRHGESEANVSPTFSPADSPLTELGREQARLLSERARRIPYDVLISSSLLRARQTAEIIAQATGGEIENSDLFVERQPPSSLKGRPREDENAVMVWKSWQQSLFQDGKKVEDGENFSDLISRADSAIRFLEARTEQTIFVVTHGFFLKTIIARILLDESLTPEAFRSFQFHSSITNSGLSLITHHVSSSEKRWRVHVMNDRAHLG